MLALAGDTLGILLGKSLAGVLLDHDIELVGSYASLCVFLGTRRFVVE